MGSYTTRTYSLYLILCATAGAIMAYCAPAAAQTGSIADPIVRQAVRDELGIDPGDPVTDADLLGLTWFRMIGDSPRVTIDVTGLEKATNLTDLTLWNYEIADTSIISSMSSLNSLALKLTGTNDISPFTQMTSLSKFSLYGNNVSNLAGLENMQQLTWLSLAYNNISDLTPIESLESLRTLSLRDNDLDSSACAILQALPELRVLGLMGNSIDSIDFLSGLSGLEDLFLAENNISDIAPLAQMTNLQRLDLKGNPLNDAAYDVYIPLIQANNPGVGITFDPIPEPTTALLLLIASGVVAPARLLRRMKRSGGRTCHRLALPIALLAFLSAPAFATELCIWDQDQTNSWTDSDNWDPDRVPIATDNIIIDGDGIPGGWAIVEYAPSEHDPTGPSIYSGASVTIGDRSIVTQKSDTLVFNALLISGVFDGEVLTSGLNLSAEGLTDPILDVTRAV